MVRVGGVAVAVAMALNIVASEHAAAESRDDPRFLLFSNADLWRHGGFLHGGVVWSPAGVDREGFALKLMFGGGRYQYVSGALGSADVDGRLLAGAAMPGWRFVTGKFIGTVYAGLDAQHHRLSPDDPSAGLRGGYWGLRVNAELWYEPTASTMIAADGLVSTIGTSYNARLAVGWRVFERFYLGPDVQGFAAGDNYRQLRAGIHLTGLKTARLEWSAGIGWTTDTDDRDGVYGKLGILVKR